MTKPTRRLLKIQGINKAKYAVPHIRLAGVWLSELGFHVGGQVQITIRERLLVIEPVVIEDDHQAALEEMKQALKDLL